MWVRVLWYRKMNYKWDAALESSGPIGRLARVTGRVDRLLEERVLLEMVKSRYGRGDAVVSEEAREVLEEVETFVREVALGTLAAPKDYYWCVWGWLLPTLMEWKRNEETFELLAYPKIVHAISLLNPERVSMAQIVSYVNSEELEVVGLLELVCVSDDDGINLLAICLVSQLVNVLVQMRARVE